MHGRTIMQYRKVEGKSNYRTIIQYKKVEGKRGTKRRWRDGVRGGGGVGGAGT